MNTFTLEITNSTTNTHSDFQLLILVMCFIFFAISGVITFIGIYRGVIEDRKRRKVR